MALPPISSLRSLVLLMSHGKPQLRAFFSGSVVAARQAAPGGDTPAAPSMAPSDDGAGGGHPIHGGPSRTSEETSTCIVEDPEQPIPAGSCCTLPPPPARPPTGRSDIPVNPIKDGPGRVFPIPGNPRRIFDESTCISKDPAQPIPADKCCMLPPPAKPPSGGRSDIPINQIPDGPRKIIDKPSTCIPQDPEQPNPAVSCCTLPPAIDMPVQHNTRRDSDHENPEDPKRSIAEDPCHKAS